MKDDRGVVVTPSHPQREAFARWARKEGLDPDRIAVLHFNGPSIRSAKTVTVYFNLSTRDRQKTKRGTVKSKPRPYVLNDQVALGTKIHRIKHRPPKPEPVEVPVTNAQEPA